MRIDVITIFPEMFDGPLATSMVGLAIERGLLDVRVHDLRTWTHDRHRSVDDAPYGGGPGMVMKPEPIFEAVEAVSAMDSTDPFRVILTPRGRRLDQALVESLASKPRLLFICGRYEGFDERVMSLGDLELSIGDYVLTGGELPALVTIDAVARLQPGVLGHDLSAVDESFADGLLEYPQYTRPASFRGMDVPPVLLSGDHARIDAWRREQAIILTARLRPDLLARAALDDEERALAEEVTRRDADSSGTDEKGA